MKILRTPDERFANLPDFPFEPRYCEVPSGYTDVDLRIHYVDEGPRDGHVALLLHGEPAWCYMWRRIIPPLADAGYRVVALDLPGFGRSDKPADAAHFSFGDITHWLRLAIALRLEISSMTAIGHGLGALIALSLASAHWRALQRVLVTSPLADLRASAKGEGASLAAAEYGRGLLIESAGAFVQRHTLRELPPEVVAAYDAPFPDAEYRMGLGASLERGTTSGDPLEEQLDQIRKELGRREIETLYLSGEHDRFAAPLADGGEGLSRVAAFEDAGHFPAEDDPTRLTEIALEFLASSR